MDILTTIWLYLGTRLVVQNFCFFHGLISVQLQKNPLAFLTDPLTTLFDGILTGILYTFGGDIIYDMLPSNCRQIIPILITVSALYSILRSIAPPV
jgi:hypothetical protein